MRHQKKKKQIRLISTLLAGLLGAQQTAVLTAAELPADVEAQIHAVLTLADTDYAGNIETIKILLQQCINSVDPDDPAAATLNSVMILLDTQKADASAVTLLLKTLVDSQGAGTQEADSDGTDTAETGAADAENINSDAEEAQEETADAAAPAESANVELSSDIFGGLIGAYSAAGGMDAYSTDAFVTTVIPESILIDVPSAWGNNASGRAVTSYSPANGSGAIDPSAGTVMISYFPMEGADENSSFDIYEKSLNDMSVTAGLVSEDLSAANLPARKISFYMNVGANQYQCEVICFAYDGTVYSIELMQGQQAAVDYFPVYYEIVDSAEIGTPEQVAAVQQGETSAPEQSETGAPETSAPEQSETTAPETSIPEQSETGTPETSVPEQSETGTPETSAPEQSETTAPETSAPEQTETGAPETSIPEQTEASAGMSEDMSSFNYSVNGHTYQFPTVVYDTVQGDFQLDWSLTLPYDFSSDADMNGGTWTELVNTQIYTFQESMYQEMISVTNLSGYPELLSDGTLTGLLDTQGSEISLTLPGNIHVGSTEQDILTAFPDFAQTEMDGTAKFRGNELLYARNIRDDGCNGYVMIRNDPPFYSAVSIICDEGTVIEIKFECIGEERAAGIFL